LAAGSTGIIVNPLVGDCVDGRRAEVRRQFVEFDRDSDGVVSVDEAHNVLQRQLGFTVDQSAKLVVVVIVVVVVVVVVTVVVIVVVLVVVVV